MEKYRFFFDKNDKNKYYQFIQNIDYENYLKNLRPELTNAYYLSEYGVIENNSPLQNKNAINSLIKRVAACGGGTVVVDGTFKTGTVNLADNITLYIKKGCALIAPDYQESLTYNVMEKGFINAEYAKNICVCGPGKIVGNGTSYTYPAADDSPLFPLKSFNVKDRVVLARKRLRKGIEGANRLFNMIRFLGCENAKVQNLHINDGSFWTCLIQDSKNVLVQNTVLDNNVHVANCDGIDIVNCQNVIVDHCFIATADDGLCIKSNSGGKVENVTFTDNKVLSMANPFKIGTETGGDITCVTLKDCYFFMPEVVGGYAGISVESADGANVKDVTAQNVVMDGISSPLLIWLGNRLRKGGSDGVTPGSIEDVKIINVTAKNTELPMAVTGCVHNGKTLYVKNVLLKDVTAVYRDSDQSLNIGAPDFEPSMSDYPEITRVIHQYINSHEESVYLDMPVYGLFVRHADGLILDNVNVAPPSSSILPKDNVQSQSQRYDTINVVIKQ